MAELCPKCGDDDLRIRFQPVGRGLASNDYEKYEEECLKKKCRRCGYDWDEPCKDAKEAP